VDNSFFLRTRCMPEVHGYALDAEGTLIAGVECRIAMLGVQGLQEGELLLRAGKLLPDQQDFEVRVGITIATSNRAQHRDRLDVGELL
jgi:hypothetical protein